MNFKSVSKAQALTLIEFIVVVACMVILATLVMPRSRWPHKANRIACVSHLKQILTANKIFAADHKDRFVGEVRVPNADGTKFTGIRISIGGEGGKTYDLRGHGTDGNGPEPIAAFAYFIAMSNELGTPKVLNCPGLVAKRKNVATDWTTSTTTGLLNASLANDAASTRLRNYRRGWMTSAVGKDNSVGYAALVTAKQSVPQSPIAFDHALSWGDFKDSSVGNRRENDAMRSGNSRHSHANARIDNREFFMTELQGVGNLPHGTKALNVALADGSVNQWNETLWNDHWQMNAARDTNGQSGPLRIPDSATHPTNAHRYVFPW